MWKSDYYFPFAPIIFIENTVKLNLSCHLFYMENIVFIYTVFN